jgi:hypothetical protein
MKKLFIVFFIISISMPSLFAADSVTFEKKEQSPKSCTRSVTVTKSSEVECDESTMIVIQATSTQTVTAETCAEAEIEATIIASVYASTVLSANIQARNWICP